MVVDNGDPFQGIILQDLTYASIFQGSLFSQRYLEYLG